MNEYEQRVCAKGIPAILPIFRSEGNVGLRARWCIWRVSP